MLIFVLLILIFAVMEISLRNKSYDGLYKAKLKKYLAYSGHYPALVLLLRVGTQIKLLCKG